MATAKKVVEEPKRRRPPAPTPEARERQMVGLAVDLAEKQLREGTASSQVLSHFLKLATVRERKELEILEHQKVLLQAKTEAMQSAKNVEKLYKNALNAMRNYSGNGGDVDDD